MADPLSTRAREIVAVARDVLEREGPEALTMRRIAEVLGIQAPSLYKHVPGKDALEVAISHLRRSLEVPGLISTVVRRGYRFNAVPEQR